MPKTFCIFILLSVVASLSAQVIECDNSEKCLCRLATTEGEFLPQYYGSIREYNYGQGIASINGKFALTDSLGQWVFPPCYDNLLGGGSGKLIAKKGGKWGIIDRETLREVVPFRYVEIWSRGEGFYSINNGMLKGVVDTFNRVIVPPAYDEISVFRNGYTEVEKGRRHGVINRDGKEIVPLGYEKLYIRADNFDNSFLILKKGNDPHFTYLLLDSAGNQVLPDTFHYMEGCTEQRRLGCVMKNRKYAFLDCKGKIISDFVYRSIVLCRYGGGGIGQIGDTYHYRDGTGGIKLISDREIYEEGKEGIVIEGSLMLDGPRYEYYDYEGNLKLKPPCVDSTYRSIRKDSKTYLYGYVDCNERLVIACEYENVFPFYREYNYCSHVKKNGNYGIIDIHNNIMVPFRYDFTEVLNETRCVLGKRNKKALSDMRGNRFTGFSYDKISFYEGLYKIGKGKHYGILSSEGKELLPCKYDDIQTGLYPINNKIKGDLEKLKLRHLIRKGKSGLWDISEGKIVVPCIYDELKYIDGELFLTVQDGKQGLVDRRGNEVAPCIYRDIDMLENGALIARTVSLWGVLNRKGEVVIPFEYESIEPYYGNLIILSKWPKHWN